MKHKVRYFVPLLILLAVVSVLGYRYRGLIRNEMLDFLHSFDDSDHDEVTDVTQPGGSMGRWNLARNDGIISDTSGQD